MADPPFSATVNWLLWAAADIANVPPVPELIADAAAVPEVASVAAPRVRVDCAPFAAVAEVRVSSPVGLPEPSKAQLATTLPEPMPEVLSAFWRPLRKRAAPSVPGA